MSNSVADKLTAAAANISTQTIIDSNMGLTDTMFRELLIKTRRWHIRNLHWPTAARDLPVQGRLLCSSSGSVREMALFDVEGVLVRLVLAEGYIHVTLAAEAREALAGAEAAVRAAVPERDLHEGGARKRVPITFWSDAPGVPWATSRTVVVPTWEDIAANYSTGTREQLDSLTDGFEPRAGRLLLWHGEPGTGKTYALRALAWAWRAWCDMHYVIDPENFFGNDPAYMVRVLLEETDWREETDHAAQRADDGRPERWRLLILEDTGELLTSDAKTVTGQAISRLLNVADGLLGQGLRVLILITTNEPLGRMHPAVARSGRCAAPIEFGALAPAEAQGWLSERGAPMPISAPATLADLYALSEGRHTPAPRRAVGFA